jgi:hypothetical protein
MRLNVLLIIITILLLIYPVIGDEVTLNPYTNAIIRNGYAAQTWEDKHDATSGTNVINSSYMDLNILSGTSANTWDVIARYGLTFNTTVIPANKTITSAALVFSKPLAKQAYLSGTPEIMVVGFTPAHYNYFTVDDYDQFTDNSYGSKLLSEVSTTTSTTILLYGLDGYVNKGGYTSIGIIWNFDYIDSPPAWASGKQDLIEWTYATTTAQLILSYTDTVTPVTTPTPYPGNISVNLLEKYSGAALVNQAVTLTPTSGGAGETKTSLYGETLHFGVVPGMEYWFNASRAGYKDYNETYTIPSSPGIYNVYMERILTPIANHSYAHFSVVDQTNGGLIPNAEIRLSDGQTKLTNSAGYAWFSVNNSEQINYYVSKPSGYWPAYGAMNLTADESILVALQRYTGPTATATMPGWTPVTVPTTGTGVDPVVTLSAQLRQQNVQEGMDVWYTNLPFISQFLFLLFIIGGLGLMAGGTRRN